MNVALVHWPAEAGRLDDLRACGEPRLLVVEHGDPPITADALEDWIRAPVDAEELHLRLAVLGERAARRRDRITIDDGVLRCGDAFVVLPPTEARLAAALLDHINSVVERDALIEAGWPERTPSTRQAIDVRIARLRQLLAETAIGIRTVYRRGYLMYLRAPDMASVATRVS